MELTNEDKQRIEQEALRLYPDDHDPDIDWSNIRNVFTYAYEAATLYERQQQAKQLEDDGEFDKMLQEKYPTVPECDRANQYLRDEGEDPEQLGRQGMVFVRTVLKTLEQKEQILKLEAERSELRNKVIGRIKKLEEFQKTINVPPGWIQKEIDFLNSLKK